MAGAIVTDGITTSTATITTATITTAAITNMIALPVATVAAAGANQGNAAAIATGFTLVSAADATKGVILPAAAAGLICFVKNNAAAVLKVYPNTSDAINAIAADGAFSMASLTSCIFIAYDAVTWYTIPLVAS